MSYHQEVVLREGHVQVGRYYGASPPVVSFVGIQGLWVGSEKEEECLISELI